MCGFPGPQAQVYVARDPRRDSRGSVGKGGAARRRQEGSGCGRRDGIRLGRGTRLTLEPGRCRFGQAEAVANLFIIKNNLESQHFERPRQEDSKLKPSLGNLVTKQDPVSIKSKRGCECSSGGKLWVQSLALFSKNKNSCQGLRAVR